MITYQREEKTSADQKSQLVNTNHLLTPYNRSRKLEEKRKKRRGRWTKSVVDLKANKQMDRAKQVKKAFSCYESSLLHNQIKKRDVRNKKDDRHVQN